MSFLRFAFLLSFACGATFATCKYQPRDRSNLLVRDGYLDFISPSDLRPFRQALPHVSDPRIEAALRSTDTIWYDEASMVFSYQDSIEVVVGNRANCVGRMVGENNPQTPGIHKLVNLFGPDYRFKFPFRAAAGTDDTQDVHVINFWVPPRKQGKYLPVKYWRDSGRGRFRWVFPNDTLFGEVLFERAPNGDWIVFEIRTRTRYADGWAIDLFRPFTTANALADAVTARRPQWESVGDLKTFVESLRNPETLKPHRLESTAYSKVFSAVDGTLDPLPAPNDDALVRELLTETLFTSAEGAVWKRGSRGETYAPASSGGFSVVPQGYAMGMIPVNEVSCARCHSDTGRRLGDFQFDSILYGEIWGEDRIFTWHLFEPNQYIFDTYDEFSAPTRRVNPRLAQAKLISLGKPSAADSDYSALPSAYDQSTNP